MKTDNKSETKSIVIKRLLIGTVGIVIIGGMFLLGRNIPGMRKEATDPMENGVMHEKAEAELQHQEQEAAILSGLKMLTDFSMEFDFKGKMSPTEIPMHSTDKELINSAIKIQTGLDSRDGVKGVAMLVSSEQKPILMTMVTTDPDKTESLFENVKKNYKPQDAWFDGLPKDDIRIERDDNRIVIVVTNSDWANKNIKSEDIITGFKEFSRNYTQMPIEKDEEEGSLIFGEQIVETTIPITESTDPEEATESTEETETNQTTSKEEKQ